VLEVLIGNFVECVGSLKRRLSAFVCGVFAISHKAEQTFRFFAGLLRRPRRSVRADCKEALAPECTVLDDIDWGATLASNAKAPHRFPVPGVPNRFARPKRLHGSERYAQHSHFQPFLATS
jgi:hypothetical protein